MRKLLIGLLSAATLSCAFSCKKNEPKPEPENSQVIIAYVGGYKGLVDVDKISAEKITHINYAFVDVKDGKAFLTNEQTDTVNFRTLNTLKEKNSSLKILISIGGWTWSRNFSDAMLTEEGRRTFAESAVDIMHRYNLDGVDIDWEYPAMPGDSGNVYRDEDTQNYTLMFKEIRTELNNLKAKTGKDYLLTTAVGGFAGFIEKTEMDKAQQYLDYINIMSYDYHPGGGVTVHHTNLCNSDKSDSGSSADAIVKAYIKEGVPAEKLVMGIAFYGRCYLMTDGSETGLGDTFVQQVRGMGYSMIKDSLTMNPDYVRYFDESAKAPYAFNKKNKIYVTFDDEESTRYKCEYVLEHNMGGVMFWEYSSDPKEYLLDEINKVLKK